LINILEVLDNTLFEQGEQHTIGKQLTTFSLFQGVNQSAHNGHISFHLLCTHHETQKKPSVALVR
jgi:hypothetical protein